jgi:hypothetical protein
MTQNFKIKEGKKPSSSQFFLLFLLIVYLWNTQTQSYGALIPLMLICGIAVLVDLIMRIRWIISFAIFLDMDKQEIILNHNLSFRKKRISLKDIKEVDMLNGTIILFGSTPLSKWQRIVCKTKKSNDYTIRFTTIETSERRELIKLLTTWNSSNKE